MLTVLVSGPTVTQDSPFSSLAVAVTIASTHYAYTGRDDQAELAWVAWLNTEMYTCECSPCLVVMSLGTSTKLLYVEPVSTEMGEQFTIKVYK